MYLPSVCTRCFLAELIASVVPRGIEDSVFLGEGSGEALTLSTIESSDIGRGLHFEGYKVPLGSSEVPMSQASRLSVHTLGRAVFLGLWHLSNHSDNTVLVIASLHFYDSSLVSAPLRNQILPGL